MTIKEVLDYVDRIKKNEFTDAEKIRWINEIEGYVQIQIMLLAQPECVSYYPASESDMSGIYFPSSNLMQLPRKLKAHVGGLISIEGLVSYPGNNLSGVEVLSISEDGRLIGVAEGTFIDIGTVPESAIAQLTFDGQETELLVPAPFERLYYEYVLCKISENLEESSAQNNRIATFEETWENFAEWYANNYTPATGSAEFKGYYITGKMGPPGPIGPPGENIYNITITDNSGVITADKTYAEIKAAAEKGMIIRLAGAYEGYTPSLMLTRVRSDGTVHLSGVCDNNITLVELFVESNETCHISITTLAPSEEVSKIDARLKRLEKGAKELIVTATASDNVGYTIDKTYGEIIEAMPCVMLKVVESDGSVIYCSDAQYDGSKVQFYDGTHSFQLEKYTVTSWSIGTDGRVNKSTLKSEFYSKATADSTFQKKLTAGDNITIAEDGTISSSGGGAEVFFLDVFVMTETEVITNKTYAEIDAAIDAGSVIYITNKDGVVFMPQVAKTNALIEILWLDSTGIKTQRWSAIIDSKNAWSVTVAEFVDIDRMVSDLRGKVDKVTGKGLSTNDYTYADKAKVNALVPVATSGSYNDLTDKPTIPDAVTEATVSGWGFTKNTGTYSKPTGGIPKADLASTVQTSLGKADTALQSVPSTYRTASAQDAIDSGKVDKVTGKGLSTNDYTDADKTKVDALAPVATSGSYNDLTDKPTIPSVPTATIQANTAARHEHSNKTVLDLISETVKVAWDAASTWVTTNGANVLSHLSDSIKHITAAERTAWNGKQDKLIAGDNITIAADGKTISATGGGGGASGDIETVEAQQVEIPSKLSDFENDSGFVTNSAVETALADKQDTISDLENIRSGARKGATALQAVPSTYRTASAQDAIDNGLSDRVSAIEGKEAGWNGKYSKPTGGIPKTDLVPAVQAVIDKADALALVAESGSYNDLTDKPAIPDAVTEGTVSGWGFTKNTGTYSKPTGGIPKTDLAPAVQTSLGKADSALQSHQSLAAYRTASAQDTIDKGKVDKVTGKGLSTNDYTNAAKAKVDAIPANPKYTDTVYNDTAVKNRLTAIEDKENVTLTPNAARISNVSYTAKYFPLLGMVFVRIYGKICADLNVGYDYDLFSIDGRVPDSNTALSVKCGKDAMGLAKTSSVGSAIQIRPLESGINGYDVYITGFWFT